MKHCVLRFWHFNACPLSTPLPDATALDQPVPVQLCCPARLFICLLVALVSSVLCGVSVWVCIFIAHKGYLLLSPFHYLLCFCCRCCCCSTVPHICAPFLCYCWGRVYSAASSQLTDCGSIFVFARFSRISLCDLPYHTPLPATINGPLSLSCDISAQQAILSRLLTQCQLQNS